MNTNHKVFCFVISTTVSFSLAACKGPFSKKDDSSAVEIPVAATDDPTSDSGSSSPVYPAPTLTAISPTSGASTGGTTLTLTGTGFVSGASIKVGADDCTSVDIASATSATCSVPAGVGNVTQDVTLTNVDAQVATLASAYTYSFSQVALAAGKFNPAGMKNGSSTVARFYNPTGVASDGTYVYIADQYNAVIRKILISDGTVTTFAGSGGAGSANGTGTDASFNQPRGLVIQSGYLYVADSSSYRIRKIDLNTGVVSTLAGSSYGDVDATGASAKFMGPQAITSDGTYLYVTDNGSYKIKKILITSGAVTSIAGSGSWGSADGSGTSASFGFMGGITFDGTDLYVTDTYSSTIRKVTVTGTASTVAGHLNAAGTIDNSVGTNARFSSPNGITNDGTYLYISDSGPDGTIRKVLIGGGYTTSTIGSTPSYHVGTADGTGSNARFSSPQAITYSGGNLYIADTGNDLIRKMVAATTVVTTLAGFKGGTLYAADGTGTSAQFGYALGLSSYGGNLYISDGTYNMYFAGNAIRKMILNSNIVSTLSGVLNYLNYGSNDGNASSASFYNPEGSTIDSNGVYMYVTDANNNAIRRVTLADGSVTTIAGGSYGASDGVGAAAEFANPFAVALDATNSNLYVSDLYNSDIRKIDLSTNTVSTYAGTGTYGNIDGTGTGAAFGSPAGLTRIGTDLYVADAWYCTIRKIDLTNAHVTTFLGQNGCNSPGIDGVGAAAQFNGPVALANDGTNIYITDNVVLRKVEVASKTVSTMGGSIDNPWDDNDGALSDAGFGLMTSIAYVAGSGIYVSDGYNVRRVY